MKKILFFAAAAFVALVSVTMVGCADVDEGESWSDYALRNSISGSAWHVEKVKDAKGNWVTWDQFSTFYFAVKFNADSHNFESEMFDLNPEGHVFESSRVKYNAMNNTAFTIKDAKIIEGTVSGQPYFRITLSKKPLYSMEGTLFFYKENRSYEVYMTR